MACLSGRKPLLAFVLAVFIFLVALFITLPSSNLPVEADLDLIWPESGNWAKEELAGLSLPQKVAQLLLVNVDHWYESIYDPEYQRLFDLAGRYDIGGIMLPPSGPGRRPSFFSELQQRARIPLLVLNPGPQPDRTLLPLAENFPNLLALSATGDPDLSHTVGYTTARTLRANGTNQLFIDLEQLSDQIDELISAGTRSAIEAASFEMMNGYIRGLKDGRVIATINPAYRWNVPETRRFRIPFFGPRTFGVGPLELLDFRASPDPEIQSFATDALSNLAGGSLIPVSIASTFLVEEQGFNGALVSSLHQWVEDQELSYQDAAVAALTGGIDQLLVTPDRAESAYESILRAVHQGKISEARIDESVEKILRSKAWLGLPDPLDDVPDGPVDQDTERGKRVVSDLVARQSVTVLGNTRHVLPLRFPSPRLLFLHVGDETEETTPFYFEEQLRRAAGSGFRIASYVNFSTMEYDLPGLLADTAAYDAVLLVDPSPVGEFEPWVSSEGPAPISLNGLPLGDRPLITISFGNPRLIETLPDADAHLLVYDDTPASQRAAAEALFGKAAITGSLPIDLNDRFHRGDGARLEQINPRIGLPEEIGMDGQKIQQVDSLMAAAIHEHAFPGAAVAAGRSGVITLLQGYGRFTYGDSPTVDSSSIYDIASLTKVVATTTAAMLLYEQDLLDLDAPVVNYLPQFGANGKEGVTIRQLLSHSAGFPAFRPYHTMGYRSKEAVIRAILSEKPTYRPGTRSVYSDLSMVTLALVIEQITGQPFGSFVHDEILMPLGMVNTGFRSIRTGPDTTIVPTEMDRSYRKRLLQGEVHDELAYLLGGTAGNAGLFSTAEDLSRFAYMLVNGGRMNGIQFLKPETIALFTRPVDRRGDNTRALGWDTRSHRKKSSAGTLFGSRSFGHTGYTGSSIWIDPEENLFVILLTNRVYPSRNNERHTPYRGALADIVFDSIEGPPEPLLPRPVE